MEIRKARPEDAQQIAWVHLESWKTTYPGIIPQAYIDGLKVENGAARWKTWLAEQTATVLVAEDEAVVFGFAAGGRPMHPVDGYDAELASIYLLASQQKKGAGRALVWRLAEELLAQGFTSLVVWVLRENPACGFYRRMGGTVVAEKPIEIGGKTLPEVAFGWADLRVVAAAADGTT